MAHKPKKASDVNSQSSPFIGSLEPFARAYPTVGRISIDATEHGLNLAANPYWKGAYDETGGGIVDCHHEDCRSGGFNVGREISDMIRNMETVRSASVWCSTGDAHRLDVTITIQYKS